MSKILIAEADPVSLARMARKAREAGHEVFEAYDGLEALDLCETVKPEIVLLDGLLPLLSGKEVAELLRTAPQYAALHGAKVFMMSEDGTTTPVSDGATARATRNPPADPLPARHSTGDSGLWSFQFRPA
jgi:CheY-like chemotaxis protein